MAVNDPTQIATDLVARMAEAGARALGEDARMTDRGYRLDIERVMRAALAEIADAGYRLCPIGGDGAQMAIELKVEDPRDQFYLIGAIDELNHAKGRFENLCAGLMEAVDHLNKTASPAVMATNREEVE